LASNSEPIYSLPLSANYTIMLNGQSLAQPRSISVTKFGPAYAISVDDVVLYPATHDQLTITPDGTQVMYQASESKETTISLALEGSNNSTQFQLQGVDVGAGQSVEVAVNTGQGKLAFSNAQANGGMYGLEIERANATGMHTFRYPGISILAGDTEYLDYSRWDDTGSLVLEIDHGSDGTIDEQMDLSNAMSPIYLPLISR